MTRTSYNKLNTWTLINIHHYDERRFLSILVRDDLVIIPDCQERQTDEPV